MDLKKLSAVVVIGRSRLGGCNYWRRTRVILLNYLIQAYCFTIILLVEDYFVSLDVYCEYEASGVGIFACSYNIATA